MNHKFQRAMLLLLLSGFACASELSAKTTTESKTNFPAFHVLHFKNGDSLRGNLGSINSNKLVTWNRADISQPIQFSGTNITEIQLSPDQKPIPAIIHACRVHLKNGDSLEGALLQLTEQQVTLETLFAGKMLFPRKTVQSLEPIPLEQKPVFVGPAGLEGWTMGKVVAPGIGDAGEWKYTNGAFYAKHSASIARDVKLPDVARIEFDLAWKGMLQTAIALYTSHMQPINLGSKDAGPDFGGFYSLQINSFVSAIMSVQRSAPLKYLGQLPLPALSQKTRAHFEILVDKKRASIALLVDGELAKEWTDTDGFIGTGTALRFVHQGNPGNPGSLKLSNLRVGEWDGKMKETSTNAVFVSEDLATLLNGDKVSGTVESFRNGKLSFLTTGSKLDIPLNRVSELYFGGGTREQIAGLGANVRGFFKNGGSVTFQVERWDRNGITGTSPNFDRATFNPDSFERIELNSSSTNKLSSIH